jgi:hypothetical protein
VATSVGAQPYVDLNGPYRCVAICETPGGLAHITQNGWNLNLLSEAGLASRAWIDYPGHIWVQRANEGAIYSPDGLTVQFDHGTIWQRVLEPPPPPVVRRRG